MSSRHAIRHDMLYDGQKLQWRGHGLFKATSGARTLQDASKQCDSKGGPLPEGSYYLLLIADDGPAKVDSTCVPEPSWHLQRIPRGDEAGQCELTLANWGRNRIRLTPADFATAHACARPRGGFYLHDSTKGFSHGCIEVEGRFFDALRRLITTFRTTRAAHPDKLYLLVKYLPGRSTNGGTFAT
jgi:hypothetical protein